MSHCLVFYRLFPKGWCVTMAYYDFLNIIFGPVLGLPPALAVITMSLIVSLIIILITKYTTNQSEMKRLKDEMKEHQARLKEARGNPQKAMELQKKAMEANMQYMMHSFKPTLITFIPIIFIFGWMSSVFAFESIQPQEQFTVTVILEEHAEGQVEIQVPKGVTIIGEKKKMLESSQATWNLKGTEGQHTISFDYNGDKQQIDVLVTNTNRYLEQKKQIKNSPFEALQINYKKKVVLPIGYKNWFGWLGTYIIFSIVFTMVLRKIMKVY